MLERVISEGPEATMTKAEISNEFNKISSHLGISTFRSDYVLRQAGNDPQVPLDTTDNINFFIKSRYLVGMISKDFVKLVQYIESFWEVVFEEKKNLLAEICKAQASKDIKFKKEFILKMLLTKETSKKGQCFEVTSFAILKIYLQNLGFVLNRFSTTYSNDGGIDFTAQSAIYQVTTKLTEKKLEEDLNKAPLKKRILVFKDSNLGKSDFNYEIILDYISTTELTNFLEYLIKKHPRRNLDAVIETMLSEFQREYYVIN
jgi:hypothetical protein